MTVESSSSKLVKKRKGRVEDVCVIERQASKLLKEKSNHEFDRNQMFTPAEPGDIGKKWRKLVELCNTAEKIYTVKEVPTQRDVARLRTCRLAY